MKCPDCGAELKSHIRWPEYKPDKIGTEWVTPTERYTRELIICSRCGFYAHRDYWEARDARSNIPYQNIPFQPKTHFLKIEQRHFANLSTGYKTFEIRKNDRGFKVGHFIIFQLWSAEGGYCKQSLAMAITYITDFPEGLKPGYIVMGVRKL